MSLRDKIKARPENAGATPTPEPKAQDIEVTDDEINNLNAELDNEIKSENLNIEPEEQLTPEQIQARTQESYEDEIKKLREENAKRRKKEQTAKEKALKAAEEIFKSEREQYQSDLAEMKKQLEELKNLKKEEDKADEVVKSTQTNAEIEALRVEMAELKKERDEAKAREVARLKEEEEEKALRKKAAENRFYAMLNDVPEEYKEYATAMFKGYSDPSEGLIAITKAKTQGLFGKKTIEVVSQVPKDNNNKETTVLNPRQKRAKKIEALKKKRQGLRPGERIL